MEKKEELLERLVNGIETQNKLIAMLLAFFLWHIRLHHLRGKRIKLLVSVERLII